MIDKKIADSMKTQMQPSKKLISETKQLVSNKQDAVKFHSHGRFYALTCCCLALLVAGGAVLAIYNDIPIFNKSKKSKKISDDSSTYSSYNIDSLDGLNNNNNFGNNQPQVTTVKTEGFEWPEVINDQEDIINEEYRLDTSITDFLKNTSSQWQFYNVDTSDSDSGLVSVSLDNSEVNNLIYSTYTPVGYILCVYGVEHSYLAPNESYSSDYGNQFIELPSEFDYNWENSLKEYHADISRSSKNEVVIGCSSSGTILNYLCYINYETLEITKCEKTPEFTLCEDEFDLYSYDNSIHRNGFQFGEFDGYVTLSSDEYTFTQKGSDMYFTHNNNTINLNNFTDSNDVYFKSQVGLMQVYENVIEGNEVLTVVYPSSSNQLCTINIDVNYMTVLTVESCTLDFNNTGIVLDSESFEHATTVETIFKFTSLIYNQDIDNYTLNYEYFDNNDWQNIYVDISSINMKRIFGDDYNPEKCSYMLDNLCVKSAYVSTYTSASDGNGFNNHKCSVLVCKKSEVNDIDNLAILIKLGNFDVTDQMSNVYVG